MYKYIYRCDATAGGVYVHARARYHLFILPRKRPGCLFVVILCVCVCYEGHAGKLLSFLFPLPFLFFALYDG